MDISTGQEAYSLFKKCQNYSRWHIQRGKFAWNVTRHFQKAPPSDNLSFGIGSIFFVIFPISLDWAFGPTVFFFSIRRRTVCDDLLLNRVSFLFWSIHSIPNERFPRGQHFDVNTNFLSLWSSVASFKS